MTLLYPETTQTNRQYVLVLKLKHPLTQQQKQRLLNCRTLMEQKANVYIQKVGFKPNQIHVYFKPKTQGFQLSIIWAIVAIAAAIGIPLTAWFITQAPAPGPLGLPQWFWVGLGVGIPLFGLALVLYMARH